MKVLQAECDNKLLEKDLKSADLGQASRFQPCFRLLYYVIQNFARVWIKLRYVIDSIVGVFCNIWQSSLEIYYGAT